MIFEIFIPEELLIYIGKILFVFFAMEFFILIIPAYPELFKKLKNKGLLFGGWE